MWDKHITLGSPGVGLIPLLQDYYAVREDAVPQNPPQVTSTGQGWSDRTPYTALVSRPYLYFLSPPLMGAMGWPRHKQLHVATDDVT